MVSINKSTTSTTAISRCSSSGGVGGTTTAAGSSNHHHHHYHNHTNSNNNGGGSCAGTICCCCIEPPVMTNTGGIYIPKKTFIIFLISSSMFILAFCRSQRMMKNIQQQQQQQQQSLLLLDYNNNNNNNIIEQQKEKSSLYSSSSNLYASEIMPDVKNLRRSGHHHHGSTSENDANDDTNTNTDEICHWYLAESSVAPNSGLGVYAGDIGVMPNEIVGIPDICIFVSDAPAIWTHLRSHSFGQGSFFGQYEGKTGINRAACEGFTTLFNTVPTSMVNTALGTPLLSTNGGLHRNISPGAGAITHHYGMHNIAKDIITAGTELTIDYGDWDFSKDPKNRWNKKYRRKPQRPVDWLKKYGWCIDNLTIRRSTVEHAGRGAFAKRTIQQGQVIVPLPLQIFQDRKLFEINNKKQQQQQNTKQQQQQQQQQQKDSSTSTTTTAKIQRRTNTEQLFVNYCFQPKDSNMLLFPYGPVGNLINHGQSMDRQGNKASTATIQQHPIANAYLRWSRESTNGVHHGSWLDLSYDEFWKVVTPGGLILEVVASRDIQIGEEVFIDYGTEWEYAWEKHVQNWIPNVNAKQYVYPAELDETQPLRTIYEQQNGEPYPENIATMCTTADWDRASTPTSNNDDDDDNNNKNHGTWVESDEWTWWEGMTYCHILKRYIDQNTGDYVYDVELLFTTMYVPPKNYDTTRKNNNNNDNQNDNMKDRYIDYGVPRRAIRFIEKAYMDDEHLDNAFRQPIQLPDHLVPKSWKN